MTASNAQLAAVMTTPDVRDNRMRRVTMADPLTRTATALAANTVITSALGFAFWIVASHRYSTRQVGTDSALLSSMLLLSSVTELNFSTALPRLLPQVQGNRARIVALCYLATGLAGAIAATAFALVIPHLVTNLRFLMQNDKLILALVAGLAAFNIFAVQDAVLIATRWATVVPLENAAFGLIKVGLLILFVGSMGGHGVFASWLIATALLVIPINAFLFRRVLREQLAPAGEHLALPIGGSRRKLLRYLAHDWVAGLLGQGTADLLPLIVVGMLGRTATAYFYIAFVIAAAVATFAQSFTTALLVEAAHDEALINQLARRTIVRCAALVAPGVLAAIILTPLGLRLFGSDYASHADGVLRLLLIATLPQTAVAIASSIERIRGRAHRILRYQAVAALAALALATPLVRTAGLAGIGWSWLIAQSLAAFIAMPTIRSVLVSRQVRKGAVA